MRKKLSILLTIICASCYSQSSGIGTSTPDASAALEVYSTTKGVLPPRMNTSSRDAITSPASGLMIYNTSINCLETYNGTTWVNMCCGLPDESGVVRGAAGKIWMAYNLGASAPASSDNDYSQNGHFYQWGRGSDGHQIVTWTNASTVSLVNGTTTTLSNTDNPGHSKFITTGLGGDWRSPKNDLLWQGVNGTNNPCPLGFRIPTITELTNEFNAANIKNTSNVNNSCLRIGSPTGHIVDNTGTGQNIGYSHCFWSSTVSGNGAFEIYLYPTGILTNVSSRAYARPVRCIKD